MTNRSVFDRTTENMEAVRGGYAFVRMRMESTRNAHAVHVEGTRRMYLCQCMRGATWGRTSSLNRNRRMDRKFAEGFRYD